VAGVAIMFTLIKLVSVKRGCITKSSMKG
jgi:hypothetical protein